MVAYSSSKPKLEADDVETRLGPSIKRKPMSRPRKRLNCGQGRDFFRLAAAFACAEKRESDFGEPIAKAPKDALKELAQSKYLQTHYQERSTLFVAAVDSSGGEPSNLTYGLVEKWHRISGKRDGAIDMLLESFSANPTQLDAEVYKTVVAPNGVTLSAREVAFLVAVAEHHMSKAYLCSATPMPAPVMPAPDFHRLIKSFVEDPRKRAFFCLTHDGEKILVERARLFWSHRLQIKALQETTTAESSICYFHAALRSQNKSGFDIVYSLKLNDEKVIIDGDFIKLEESNVSPHEIFFANTLLFEPTRRAICLAALDAPIRLFVEEVTRLITH